MAEMAQELYKTMLPQIQEARQAGASIRFAGHSLGGALASLLCSLTMLQLQQPTQQVTCTSFGSPPVLAHKGGKDGTAILEVGHVSCRTLMPVILSIALSLCTLQLPVMLIILPTHPKEVRCTFIMHRSCHRCSPFAYTSFGTSFGCIQELRSVLLYCSCWACQSRAYAALCWTPTQYHEPCCLLTLPLLFSSSGLEWPAFCRSGTGSQDRLLQVKPMLLNLCTTMWERCI